MVPSLHEDEIGNELGWRCTHDDMLPVQSCAQTKPRPHQAVALMATLRDCVHGDGSAVASSVRSVGLLSEALIDRPRRAHGAPAFKPVLTPIR